MRRPVPSSVAVTITSYEACVSKSGAATNVKAPVFALIAKLAASVPDIEKAIASPSTSVAVAVVTADVAFSA